MEERDQRVVDVSIPRAPTRWDERPSVSGSSAGEERSGAYLAALVAIVVPTLIVVTAIRAALLGEVARAVLPDQRVELEPPPPEDVVAEIAGPSVGADPDQDDVPSPQPAAPDPFPPAAATVTLPSSPSPGPSVPGPVPPTESSATTPTIVATIAPTTTTSTTAAPTTTSTTTTTRAPTTTTSVPPRDPVAFSQRVDIGELGDTFVRYRFTADRTSSYTAVLRRDGAIESTTAGTANEGEQVNARFDGLLPGNDYSVQIVLAGPPEAVSAAVAFRTPGAAATAATAPVEVLDLRIADLGETRVELHYESNICANGSFTIVDAAGTLVGSNQGQAVGCTTRHLAIPGFWTPALEPGTSYTITVTVEADGRGLGGGNVASTSLTLTTTEGN